MNSGEGHNTKEGFSPRNAVLLDKTKKEIAKLKVTMKEIVKITQSTTAGHWIAMSEFSKIDRRSYNKLQTHCIKNNIDAFTEDYDSFISSSIIEKKDDDILNSDVSYFNSMWLGTTDVFEVSNNSYYRSLDTINQEHYSPKPLNLLIIPINTSSKERDNVLDPFGGSGSTLISCQETNRNCFMMEFKEEYCDLIIARFEKRFKIKAFKVDKLDKEIREELNELK